MSQHNHDGRRTPAASGPGPILGTCEADLATRTEAEDETLDLPEGMRGFTPGQVLGERYQIVEMPGRGGMGEVWHAFDLRLRVEVALKARLEAHTDLRLLRDDTSYTG
jgi:hypothetical protein